MYRGIFNKGKVNRKAVLMHIRKFFKIPDPEKADRETKQRETIFASILTNILNLFHFEFMKKIVYKIIFMKAPCLHQWVISYQ